MRFTFTQIKDTPYSRAIAPSGSSPSWFSIPVVHSNSAPGLNGSIPNDIRCRVIVPGVTPQSCAKRVSGTVPSFALRASVMTNFFEICCDRGGSGAGLNAGIPSSTRRCRIKYLLIPSSLAKSVSAIVPNCLSIDLLHFGASAISRYVDAIPKLRRRTATERIAIPKRSAITRSGTVPMIESISFVHSTSEYGLKLIPKPESSIANTDRSPTGRSPVIAIRILACREKTITSSPTI